MGGSSIKHTDLSSDSINDWGQNISAKGGRTPAKKGEKHWWRGQPHHALLSCLLGAPNPPFRRAFSLRGHEGRPSQHGPSEWGHSAELDPSPMGMHPSSARTYDCAPCFMTPFSTACRRWPPARRAACTSIQGCFFDKDEAER
jgi:hypothetical protein